MASCPLKSESAASWFIPSPTAHIVQSPQRKGTDSPAEKVTAKNKPSPVSIYYLPHWCPTPQPRVFSEADACGLGSSSNAQENHSRARLTLRLGNHYRKPRLREVAVLSSFRITPHHNAKRSQVTWPIISCRPQLGNTQHSSVFSSDAHSHWDIINGNQCSQWQLSVWGPYSRWQGVAIPWHFSCCPTSTWKS